MYVQVVRKELDVEKAKECCFRLQLLLLVLVVVFEPDQLEIYNDVCACSLDNWWSTDQTRSGLCGLRCTREATVNTVSCNVQH